MIVVLACLFLTGVSADHYGDELDRSELQFDLNLFHSLAVQDHGKNFVLSPASVYYCLTYVYLAAAGKTDKGLEILLGWDKLDPKMDKSNLLKSILSDEKLSNDTKQANLYARIYIDNDIKLKPDKKKQFGDLLELFKTGVNREDEINKWIASKTHGMIKEIVARGSLTPYDKLIFVNAAYFKALWMVPFLGGTTLRPFTLNDGSVIQTPLMSIRKGENNFQSIKDLEAEVIELPYKKSSHVTEGQMSMFIMLPTSVPKKGSPPPIEGLVKKLTADKIMEVISTLKNAPFCKTDLVIPKFEYEEDFELKKVLSGLKGGEVLKEELDLTNLLEPGQPPLYVSKVVHKARMNVYENGTVAAAATAVEVVNSLPPRCSNKFVADHPFVYFIYDGKRKVVHFIGVLNNPKH